MRSSIAVSRRCKGCFKTSFSEIPRGEEPVANLFYVQEGIGYVLYTKPMVSG